MNAFEARLKSIEGARERAFKDAVNGAGLAGVVIDAATGLFDLRAGAAPADAAPCLALSLAAAECDACVRLATAAEHTDATAAAMLAPMVRVPEAPSWLPLVYGPRGGFVGLESIMAWTDGDGLDTLHELSRSHPGVWLDSRDVQPQAGVEVCACSGCCGMGGRARHTVGCNARSWTHDMESARACQATIMTSYTGPCIFLGPRNTGAGGGSTFAAVAVA